MPRPKLKSENCKSADRPSAIYATAPLPTAELDDEQRLACLRLIRSENIGPVAFRELINRYGGATAALEAVPDLSTRGGRTRPIKICSRENAEHELESALRFGAKPVFTIEPGYPSRLALIDVPPPLLYVKGDVGLLQKPAIAIVGARQASAAGTKLARVFATALGKAGLVIISGLARGIDGTAHHATLETGTVAVLAGGLDNIYPPEHEDLHQAIAAGGCLISEMPCGFKPRAKDFPRRNRIISGTSLGVLVVEAARRSGTLVTARMAGEQGREVFAIPGHPLDPRAEGTNQLLKTGATLVTEPGDVLETLEPLTDLGSRTFREPGAAMQTPAAEPLPPPQTDPDQRSTVLSALGPAPVDIDELSRATNLTMRHIRAILMELELAGRIERHGATLVSAMAPASSVNHD